MSAAPAVTSAMRSPNTDPLGLINRNYQVGFGLEDYQGSTINPDNVMLLLMEIALLNTSCQYD